MKNNSKYLVKCCEPTMTVEYYVNAFDRHVFVLIAFPLSVFLPHRQSLWHLERFADVVMRPKNHTLHTYKYNTGSVFGIS